MKTKNMKLGLVGIVLSLAACSDPSDAVRAASSEGWRNVRVVDSQYAFNFTCAEGEIAYKIVGENPRGEQSNATVCCGYTNYKGCTIRH